MANHGYYFTYFLHYMLCWHSSKPVKYEILNRLDDCAYICGVEMVIESWINGTALSAGTGIALRY